MKTNILAAFISELFASIFVYHPVTPIDPPTMDLLNGFMINTPLSSLNSIIIPKY